MKTVEVNLYEYEELSDIAKQTALNHFIAQGDNFDSSEGYESLKAFENIFPITIKETNYGYGGIWMNFEFTEDETIENLTGWRLATYIWNNYRRHIYTYKHYYTKYNAHGGARQKIRISKIKLESQSCPFTGVCYDEDILDPLWKFLKEPNGNTNFEELMRKCIYSFLDTLDKENDYRQSEEAFEETCDANEWLFTEDGEKWE